MRKSVSSNSIFRQLVLDSLIISIIPIFLGAVIIFRIFSGMSKETAMASYEQVASRYMFDIDEMYSQIDGRLRHLSVDSNVVGGLTGKTDFGNPVVAGQTITSELTKILQLDTRPGYHNCVVYSRVEDNPVVGKYVTNIKEAEIESWYSEDRLKDGAVFFYKTANGKTTVFSMVREIRDIDSVNLKSTAIGFIKLDINAKTFFNPGNSKNDDSAIFDVIIVDGDNTPVYATKETESRVLDAINSGAVINGQFNELKNSLVYMKDLGINDYKAVLVFDNKPYTSRRFRVFIPITATFLMLIAAIVVLSYLFAKRFSGRINLLMNKIKQVETGNFAETEPIGGNDEIAELDNVFMEMQKELNNLINKNYMQTLLNKEYELKNLQLQINPHFLYNTLESISSLSAVKGNFEICEICEKLGEIFRYSLGKNYGNFVPLSQEIKHIENYVFIQKTRYGDKFDVYYSIPDEVKNLKILRFILQPIVENAIIHGVIPNNKKGNIEISAVRNFSGVLLTVEDDGVGMTEEKVNELNEYIKKDFSFSKDKSESIGIRNVNKRIELMCGPYYGIVIKSEPDKGSRFEIQLPFTERGAKL